jgi:hypothetical protein
MMATRTAVTVDEFMADLDHPMKPEIGAIRALITGLGDEATEQVKWNAPSFCYRGDDRITFRLHPKGFLQLIFHRGVTVKDATDFSFEDEAGLLQWASEDRGVVTFKTAQEVEANRDRVRALAARWMATTA